MSRFSEPSQSLHGPGQKLLWIWVTVSVTVALFLLTMLVTAWSFRTNVVPAHRLSSSFVGGLMRGAYQPAYGQTTADFRGRTSFPEFLDSAARLHHQFGKGMKATPYRTRVLFTDPRRPVQVWCRLKGSTGEGELFVTVVSEGGDLRVAQLFVTEAGSGWQPMFVQDGATTATD